MAHFILLLKSFGLYKESITSNDTTEEFFSVLSIYRHVQTAQKFKRRLKN